MKALLPVGIVLVVAGILVGFGHQLLVAAQTGLPTGGIGWMQTSGFVLAAGGAILIGVWISKRRAAKRAAAEHTQTGTHQR